VRAQRRSGAGVWLGGLIARYLRRVALAEGEVIGLESLERRASTGRRVFFCYRNQDALLLALALAVGLPGSRLAEVDFVCDDSLAGRVSAGVIEGLGHRRRWLRRRAFGLRARDVQAIMRSRRSIGITVDAQGPYGVVNEGLPRLGARCRALLVPVAAAAERSRRIWRTPPVALPLPGGLVAVVAGEGVPGEASDARERLQLGLERAAAEARAAARGREAAGRGRVA